MKYTRLVTYLLIVLRLSLGALEEECQQEDEPGELYNFEHEKTVKRALLYKSSNNHFVASLVDMDTRLHVHQLEGGASTISDPMQFEFRALAVASWRGRAGSYLYSGHADSKIRLWDAALASKEPIKAIFADLKDDKVRSLAVLSGDGEVYHDGLLMVGGEGGTLRALDLKSGEQLFSLPKMENEVSHLQAFRNGTGHPFLLSGSISGGNRVFIWDLEAKQLPREVSCPETTTRMTSVQAFYRNMTSRLDEELTLAAVRHNDPARGIVVWEAHINKTIKIFKGHREPVMSLATYERQGSPVLVSASVDGSIRIWDLTRREEISSGYSHADAAMHVSTGLFGDKAVIVSSSKDRKVRVWSTPAPLFLLDSLLESEDVRKRGRLVKLIEELQGLTGLQKVKAEAAKLIHLSLHRNLAADSRLKHMVFQGPPGTGKTTVAQLIGQILVEIGQGQKYVAVDHIGQLIGPFTNTEAKHIHEFLHDNTNNVMFLDEAHQLGDDPERASLRLSVVNRFLSDHSATFTMIIAGYQEKLQELVFSKDPGLKSRFQNNVFEFEAYRPEELAHMFQRKARSQKWVLHDSLDFQKLTRFFESHANLFADGNGRTLTNLVNRAGDEQLVSMVTDCEVWQENVLRISDVERALKALKNDPAPLRLVSKEVRRRREARATLSNVAEAPATEENQGLQDNAKAAATGGSEGLSAAQEKKVANMLQQQSASTDARIEARVQQERMILQKQFEEESKRQSEAMEKRLEEKLQSHQTKLLATLEQSVSLIAQRFQAVEEEQSKHAEKLSEHDQQIAKLNEQVAMLWKAIYLIGAAAALSLGVGVVAAVAFKATALPFLLFKAATGLLALAASAILVNGLARHFPRLGQAIQWLFSQLQEVIKGLLWTLLGLPSLNLELLELCAALVLVGLFLLWRRRGTSTNTKQQGSETSKANRELEGLKEEVARLATQIMASETLDEVESLKDEVASLAMQIKELQEQRERRSAEAEGRKTEAPETTIAGGSST